jgi:thymidine kinase
MINISGANDTAEYAAALALQSRIITTWPDVVNRADHRIALVAAAKCYGQRICDIDLILFLDLTREPRPIDEGNRPFFLTSACITIEVKDHLPDSVRFVGNQVEVRYHERWHNVSEQSFRQRFALRGYLEAHRTRAPWIVNLLWLRHVPESCFPHNIHNIIGSDTTWEAVLERLHRLCRPHTDRSGRRYINAWGNLAKSVHLFTHISQPPLTTIEQDKVTGVIKASASHDKASAPKYIQRLGSQMLIFQGRGGTGKTASLLKLAHLLYEYSGQRILILTYNRALVADIKRLLTLIGVHDGAAQRSIVVQTAHSYFYDLLKGLGILPQPCNDFLQRYEHYKAEALRLLRNVRPGNADDLERVIVEHNDAFSWDYIFIDEGQDWPVDQRDILFSLYDYRKFVIADGLDQLTWGGRLDWRETIDPSQTQIVTLSKSLRLRAGVCHFVNAFARHVGLADWVLEPYGKERGRVVVLEGYYAQSPEFHAELMQQHSEQQRSPIDMLFCAPPRLVRQDAQRRRYCVVAPILEEWGYATWDATNMQATDQFPTDLDQLRIVQYDSCRGLEAWTVIHLGFDELYDYKVASYEWADDNEQPADYERRAHEHALRWLMIPLTRAIHTLVIQVTSADHPIARILKTIAEQHPDLVEWKCIEGE